MRALAASEILGLWEAGRDRTPLDRALLLWAAADPGPSREQLERLPIGRRDRAILELRERTFGPDLWVSARCEGCGARVEFTVSTAELRSTGDLPPDEQGFRSGDWSVRFRTPTSLDVAESLTLGSPEAARRRLLDACLLEITYGSEAREASSLPVGLLDEIEAAMARSDASSEILLRYDCPGCGRPGEVQLDPASVFWEELAAQARRLLLEVHHLASAYGWSEAEILLLSPARRQAYLEQVAS